MDGSFASSAFSNAASDWCAGPGSWYASVEAHQTITAREQLFLSMKARMSCTSWLTSSRLAPVFTLRPSRRLTQAWSKTAGMGLMPERNSLSGASSSGPRTRAQAAARRLHAGDEGGGHRAQAGQQHGQLPFRGGDLRFLELAHVEHPLRAASRTRKARVRRPAARRTLSAPPGTSSAFSAAARATGPRPTQRADGHGKVAGGSGPAAK